MNKPTLSEQPKRSYHSPARERQAEESRQRILEAARTLFTQQGYAKTTIDTIAKIAGLSPKTVTAIFGSKQGILAVLVHPSTVGARYRQLIGQLKLSPDPREQLGIVAQIARQLNQALSPEFNLLRGAATVAPELAELAQQVESRRKMNQEHLINSLEEQSALRQHLQHKEALDEVWTLTSYDLYRWFVIECNWTLEQYEAWLTTVLHQRLLGD
jgi:AcrR family transcriptional regulator